MLLAREVMFLAATSLDRISSSAPEENEKIEVSMSCRDIILQVIIRREHGKIEGSMSCRDICILLSGYFTETSKNILLSPPSSQAVNYYVSDVVKQGIYAKSLCVHIRCFVDQLNHTSII